MAFSIRKCVHRIQTFKLQHVTRTHTQFSISKVNSNSKQGSQIWITLVLLSYSHGHWWSIVHCNFPFYLLLLTTPEWLRVKKWYKSACTHTTSRTPMLPYVCIYQNYKAWRCGQWEKRPEQEKNCIFICIKKPAHQNQSPLKAYRYKQRESYYCRLFVIENYLLGASILLISYGARIHFTTMFNRKKNNSNDDDMTTAIIQSS